MSFAFYNLHDLIHMGHHGIYVWTAWLITMLALALLVIQSRVERQRFFHDEMAKVRFNKVRNEQLKQDSRQ